MTTNQLNKINAVALAGSLRKDSINRAALRASAALAPTELDLTELSIAAVPFFDADVEAQGDPESVVELKTRVNEADALLLFLPEYNGSFSAVAKNAIDWLSRPAADGSFVLNGKPVGIVSASPGPRGGQGVRSDAQRILGYMTDALFDETFGIASAFDKFDGEYLLSDSTTVASLSDWLQRFHAHAESSVSIGPRIERR